MFIDLLKARLSASISVISVESSAIEPTPSRRSSISHRITNRTARVSLSARNSSFARLSEQVWGQLMKERNKPLHLDRSLPAIVKAEPRQQPVSPCKRVVDDSVTNGCWCVAFVLLAFGNPLTPTVSLTANDSFATLLCASPRQQSSDLVAVRGHSLSVQFHLHSSAHRLSRLATRRRKFLDLAVH